MEDANIRNLGCNCNRPLFFAPFICHEIKLAGIPVNSDFGVSVDNLIKMSFDKDCSWAEQEEMFKVIMDPFFLTKIAFLVPIA